MPYDLNELVISHSSRNMYHGCERKLEFRKFFDSSRRTESFAGRLGNIFHEMVQTWVVDKDVNKSIGHLATHFPAKYCKSIFDAKSAESMFGAFHDCIQHPAWMKFEIAQFNIDGELKPAIEVPFQINFTNFNLNEGLDLPFIPVKYIGYIDAIMFNLEVQKHEPIDFKTTSIKGPLQIDKFAYDEQCVPYALVLEALLNKTVTSLTYNYAHIKFDLLEPITIFETYNKTQADIVDWKKAINFDLNAIRTNYQSQFFPRRASSCFAWKSLCQFHSMCKTRNMEYIKQMINLDAESVMPDNSYNARPEFKPWITLDIEL